MSIPFLCRVFLLVARLIRDYSKRFQNKNESNSSEQPAETSVQTLHSKIIDLEKQLATVIQKNLKLTEENNKLRELMATHK